MSVSVTDSNGVSASSGPLALTVAPALTATAGANATFVVPGQSIRFESTGSGGTGALSFSWQFGDGSSGSGAAPTHAYSAGGNYTVTVWVNDTVGGSVEKTQTIHVTAPSPRAAPTSSGPNDLSLGVAAAGVLVVGVIAALFLVQRRRSARRSGASGDTSFAEGGEGATPPESGQEPVDEISP